MSAPLLLSRFDKTARWMRRGGRDGDVVLSSRVRLARNLRRYEFPHLASSQDLLQVRQRAFAALEGCAGAAPDALFLLPFEEFTEWERASLIDRHFSSREHVRDELGRAVAATPDGSLSVMINEEDHLRVQSLLPGLQLDAAWDLADRLDDALEAHFDAAATFAFDHDLGYLTACPTNAGTGLRASVMLHLPALELTGRLEKVRRRVEARGLALRGTFGEGSRVWGHLHQVSNATTLGLAEDETLVQVENAARELVDDERAARELLPEKFSIPARDRVGRALGLLRYARSLSCLEATEALSWLRLGHEIGWLRGLSRGRFNELLVWIRPNYLQVLNGHMARGPERALMRADLLRPSIAKIKLEPAFDTDLKRPTLDE